MISRLRYLIWLIWKKAVHRPVLSILLALIFIYLGATFVVMAYEDAGFGSAAMKIFPAFFGEVGEVETPFIAVQISIIIGIIVSVTFLAVITAKITSALIEFIRRGGSMAKKVNFSGHTLICGWNFQGKRVVKELLAATVKQQRGIVILTESDRRPVEDDRVEFIKGDPSQDENLIRAGIERANSVIVLTDFNKGANEADAEALMVVLAVESLNRKVHTCVQLMNSANRMHLEHAHADEIICLDQMGGSLVVASALNHGVSRVVAGLLTFDKGSEFYRYDRHLSEAMVGKEFSQALQLLAQKQIILLAVETDYTKELQQQLGNDIICTLPEEDRAMILNPQSRYQIRQGDALFLVAESEPTKL
jgi:voltage-gated potassium channel